MTRKAPRTRREKFQSDPGPRSARRRAVLTGALALLLLGACGEPAKTVAPQEITRETFCALDGMLLMDYPGPKGQIHYDQGEPDFFCDTVEMFALYLRPEQKKRVVAVFTQDMGKADWNEPRGHWIDARSAFYVAGSRKAGSMGPTLASFAKNGDAEAFAREFGGKVLRFDQVTLDMVSLDGGVVRDERM
jgi:copper chaperone NosL